jgi:hypothetical protein
MGDTPAFQQHTQTRSTDKKAAVAPPESSGSDHREHQPEGWKSGKPANRGPGKDKHANA